MAAGDVRVDWIAGSSIGAITAALIAGSAPERRAATLREFWDRAASTSGEEETGRTNVANGPVMNWSGHGSDCLISCGEPDRRLKHPRGDDGAIGISQSCVWLLDARVQ